MYLIGLSGKMGVGKTAIAQYIIDQLAGWQITAFADGLKDETAREYGFDVRLCYGNKDTVITLKNGQRKTVRELLQWHGTDVVRARDPHHWVRGMEAHLAASENVGIPGIVIHDVRFPNEANMVRKKRGFLVRIEPYAGYQATSSHSSENALERYQGFMLTLAPVLGDDSLREAAEQIISAAQISIGI